MNLTDFPRGHDWILIPLEIESPAQFNSIIE